MINEKTKGKTTEKTTGRTADRSLGRKLPTPNGATTTFFRHVSSDIEAEMVKQRALQQELQIVEECIRSIQKSNAYIQIDLHAEMHNSDAEANRSDVQIRRFNTQKLKSDVALDKSDMLTHRPDAKVIRTDVQIYTLDVHDMQENGLRILQEIGSEFGRKSAANSAGNRQRI